MTEKRFTTNGYYIYDHFKENKWLVNEVEAEEIVTVMDNLDTKARERSKALSKLEKENEQLKKEVEDLKQALIRCAFDDK
jgi:cell division protein FtsB